MNYGCHNAERAAGYWASERMALVEMGGDMGVVRWSQAVWITDASTKDCQYRKTTPDPKCEGCKK